MRTKEVEERRRTGQPKDKRARKRHGQRKDSFRGEVLDS